MKQFHCLNIVSNNKTDHYLWNSIDAKKVSSKLLASPTPSPLSKRSVTSKGQIWSSAVAYITVNSLINSSWRSYNVLVQSGSNVIASLCLLGGNSPVSSLLSRLWWYEHERLPVQRTTADESCINRHKIDFIDKCLIARQFLNCLNLWFFSCQGQSLPYIRAIYVWLWNENARTKQKQQTNGNRVIRLVYRTVTNACGFWLVKRTLGWKNFMPENFLEISILRFDVILQHEWPIEQSLLHIRVFFGGKTKSPYFDLFIHWLIKHWNNEHSQGSWHLPKPFFQGHTKIALTIFS